MPLTDFLTTEALVNGIIYLTGSDCLASRMTTIVNPYFYLLRVSKSWGNQILETAKTASVEDLQKWATDERKMLTEYRLNII